MINIGIRIYLVILFINATRDVGLDHPRSSGHYHSTLSPFCLFGLKKLVYFFNITGAFHHESSQLWEVSAGIKEQFNFKLSHS